MERAAPLEVFPVTEDVTLYANWRLHIVIRTPGLRQYVSTTGANGLPMVMGRIPAPARTTAVTPKRATNLAVRLGLYGEGCLQNLLLQPTAN